jgi:hypothetical protein
MRYLVSYERRRGQSLGVYRFFRLYNHIRAHIMPLAYAGLPPTDARTTLLASVRKLAIPSVTFQEAAPRPGSHR